MLVSTKIKPRTWAKDFKQKPYRLIISVLTDNEPTSRIFKENGEVGWDGYSSIYEYDGTWLQCQEERQKVLGRILDLTTEWEAAFPYKEESRSFRIIGSELKEED